MTEAKLEKLIKELSGLPAETEWIEFKENKAEPQEIGENVSALANSAALLRKHCGYIVWGIEDVRHAIVGTGFRPRETKRNFSASLTSSGLHDYF